MMPFAIDGPPQVQLLSEYLLHTLLPGGLDGERRRTGPRGRQALIKRVRLATARSGLAHHEFSGRWRAAVATAASAPAPVRPVRVTVSTSLPEVVAGQKYEGVGLEWFADRSHLLRYEAWLGTTDGEASQQPMGRAVDLDASPVVVTEERVVRGADWLGQRWQDGGPKIKQLAIATRARGLTLAQFLDLWRSRAGKIGAAPIPEAFRGLAYVQNHPQAEAGREWAYDAINEVYFDEIDSLLARIAYFERELTERAETDLVGANWFLAVQEEPIEQPR
jgi:hypothetical protein